LFGIWNFGIWDLFEIWDLVLGIYMIFIGSGNLSDIGQLPA
jgi:hypothetical protein